MEYKWVNLVRFVVRIISVKFLHTAIFWHISARTESVNVPPHVPHLTTAAARITITLATACARGSRRRALRSSAARYPWSGPSAGRYPAPFTGRAASSPAIPPLGAAVRRSKPAITCRQYVACIQFGSCDSSAPIDGRFADVRPTSL